MREMTMVAVYDILGLAIIIPFVILWLWKGLDSRLIIVLAVICLLGAGLLSIWSSQASDEGAIVAYYCLVTGALMILVEPIVFNLPIVQEHRAANRSSVRPWIESMLRELKARR